MNISRIDLDALEPREKNPNKMTEEQFALLVGAIKRVGMLQPLLVRGPLQGRDRAWFEIVDGVHRWKASKEAGLTVVDCVIVDSDEAEAAALQIGMNRIRGELDLRSVAVSLGELRAEGWTPQEMTLTGFELGEIKDLLGTLSTGSPDDLPKGSVAGVGDEKEPSAAPESYSLEILFGAKKDMQKAKRTLKKLGAGDLAAGLMALIAKDE
jgi:ParB/RepB/Spo0J family partition protein